MAVKRTKKTKAKPIEPNHPFESQRVQKLFHEIVKKDDTCQEPEVDLIETSTFPYMKFPFEKFNSMQSMVIPHIAKTPIAHLVVCSPTSSGKTVVAEAAIAHANHFQRKGIYLSPLKALSNEKLHEWTSVEHDYSVMNRKVSILTGDYQKTENKMREVNEADLIVMTSEMLDSVTRLYKPDKPDSQWLQWVGVLVIDEAHLIAEEERGDKLEALIMRLTEINPQLRIVALSATLPNVEDYGKWFTKLTNRPTETIISKYRPVPLEKHFCEYEPVSRKTVDLEEQIIEMTDLITSQHENACFLIFVTSKAFGRKMSSHFNGAGIKNFFFSADLSKDERIKLHKQYNNREFSMLLATNALAWGVNTPAKIVIVTSTRMAGTKKVSTATLIQEAGRAGRPQFDKEGKVFYLIPTSYFMEDMDRVMSGEPIVSQMIDNNVLAFHVLAEMNHERVLCVDDLVNWHRRSLAAMQTSPLQDFQAQMVIDRLEKCQMIQKKEDGTDAYRVTQMGVVTYQMYMQPEDMYNWKVGFERLFRKIYAKEVTRQDDIDRECCDILAKTAASEKMFYSKYEQEHMMTIRGGTSGTKGWNKLSDCYQVMLDPDPHPYLMDNLIGQLKRDIPRTISAIARVLYNQKEFLQDLSNRLYYGVPTYMLELCKIEGIGGKKAHKLWHGGIRTIRDFVSNHLKAKEILGEATFVKAFESARSLYGANTNAQQIEKAVGI